jgi:YD repeat-containing protein
MGPPPSPASPTPTNAPVPTPPLRQSVVDKANATTAYNYDALERLTQARTTSASGGVEDDLRYAYDAVGNRTSETLRQSGLLGTSDVTAASTYNPADQLTSPGQRHLLLAPDRNLWFRSGASCRRWCCWPCR